MCLSWQNYCSGRMAGLCFTSSFPLTQFTRNLFWLHLGSYVTPSLNWTIFPLYFFQSNPATWVWQLLEELRHVIGLRYGSVSL